VVWSSGPIGIGMGLTGWLLVAVTIAALWAVPIVGTFALFRTGSGTGNCAGTASDRRDAGPDAAESTCPHAYRSDDRSSVTWACPRTASVAIPNDRIGAVESVRPHTALQWDHMGTRPGYANRGAL
jgi:hypothetical protein